MLQGSTMTTYTIFRSKKNPASSSAKHLLDAINMISSRTADYSSVHLKRCVIPKYTCSVKLYIMAHGINTKQSKIPSARGTRIIFALPIENSVIKML